MGVPPIFKSHFARTALYLPAPGFQSWDTDSKVKRPACLARRTLVVRWSNACLTGHNQVVGRLVPVDEEEDNNHKTILSSLHGYKGTWSGVCSCDPICLCKILPLPR